MSLQAFGSFPDHDYIHRENSHHSQSDGPDSETSSQASPNSRLRRMTFPVDFESFPSQEESSHQSSPMSQARGSQEGSPHQQERQSEDCAGQHQKGTPTGSPHRQGSHNMEDGFNSDPEHSSRALRLKATHLVQSERHHSPGEGSPRHKGIRRAASEAQLMSRYNARMGSFGSHTSDSTRSFDEYLKNHRSPSPSPKSRCAQPCSRLLPTWSLSCLLCPGCCSMTRVQEGPQQSCAC